MTASETGLAERLDTLALGIAAALAADCDRRRGFPGTEFYATAFACMLWQRWPDRFGPDLAAGLTRLAEQDKRARLGDWQNPFHWEFVRFALADLMRTGPVGGFSSPRDVLGVPRFVGTRVANWMLLRSSVRIAEGRGAWLGRLERRIALALYQQPGGFIEDQRGAPTQQYHAFMTALLGYQIAVLGERSAFLREAFVRALAALQRTMLPDGEANAVGRGRFQSFGYAAALLALACGLRLGLAAPGARMQLEAVLRRFEAAAGPDGGLPLMLLETGPGPVDPVHPHQVRIGWHSYNNGPDYLAFSGALLKLAAEQMTGVSPPPQPLAPADEDSLADGIRVRRDGHYGAIATLPHAGLAAAQPLPYIVTAAGARPLPSYGGEDLPDSIYSALALPLPVFEDRSGRFRNILAGAHFRWDGKDRIVGETARLRFERTFRFENDTIFVEDALILRSADPDERLHLPWLPLPAAATAEGDAILLDGGMLESDLPLSEVAGVVPQYAMSGLLRVWSHVRVPPRGHDIARAAYRIRLTP